MTDKSLRIVPIAGTADETLVEAARNLLREYGEFVLAATGPARFCAARIEREIGDPVGFYSSRGGELLLAFAGDEAAGCAGYRTLTAGVPERACELKRLWVRPGLRGLSLGRSLAEAVFDRASTAGYEAIYLDTEPDAMPEAVRLYRRLGFEECPAYSSEVVAGLRFYRRSLSRTFPVGP